MDIGTETPVADAKVHPAGPGLLSTDSSGGPAECKGDHPRHCGRLSMRSAVLITAAALLVVAVVTIVPAIVFSTSGSRDSSSGGGGSSSHGSQKLASPQALNQSEVVVYSNLLRAAAFHDALLNRIVGTRQLDRIQSLLEGTIQSHGSYIAHLADALTASGADAWRGYANVDAAFPYDLSYASGNRTAANRSEIAALLATSILTAVNVRLVVDATELVGAHFGTQLEAAAGHHTDEAKAALISEFKADLKFADSFADLKGFLTSDPSLVLQLSTALAFSNATVSITAAGLAYQPSATYAGERRRRLQASRRALQGGDNPAADEDTTAYRVITQTQRATSSLQSVGLPMATNFIGDSQDMTRRAADNVSDTPGQLSDGAAPDTRRRLLQQNDGSSWVNSGFVDVINNVIQAMC